MNILQVPRFKLSANKSKAGKSIVAIGLAVALRKHKISLSCCVNGPDLNEAMILKRMTRRYANCIDANILGHSQSLSALQQASLGADLLMIVGKDGLFDGNSPGSLKTSDAELAALSKSPVVLVIDAEGLNNSIAALIKGYSDFSSGFKIEAFIANKCSFKDEEEDGLSHDESIRDKIYYDSVLQSFGMQNLLGAVPLVDTGMPDIESRYSQRSANILLPLQFFKDVGSLAEKYIDIERLIDVANTAPELHFQYQVQNPETRKTRIAVSDDTCFSLAFQNNTELLRFYGAEIVPFSPLADEELPERIGAVYFTGGAIDHYAEDLSRNISMKNSIRDFAGSGGIVYSEGAGSAFLCKEFEGNEVGTFFEGVGILNARAVKSASNFNYYEAVITEDSVLGRAGAVLKGLSVGEWMFESRALFSKVLRISSGTSNCYDEGYSPAAHSVCTLTYPHFGSNPDVAKSIVEAAEIVAKA